MLIPECCGRNIILKRQIIFVFSGAEMPTESLDRYLEIVFEIYRVGYMPAVH